MLVCQKYFKKFKVINELSDKHMLSFSEIDNEVSLQQILELDESMLESIVFTMINQHEFGQRST